MPPGIRQVVFASERQNMPLVLDYKKSVEQQKSVLARYGILANHITSPNKNKDLEIFDILIFHHLLHIFNIAGFFLLPKRFRYINIYLLIIILLHWQFEHHSSFLVLPFQLQ